MTVKMRGRPKRFSEYEELLKSLPRPMKKRPKYVHGIGIFRGARGDTAWIKISLPNGGVYGGKSYAVGSSLEIKLGSLASWSWQQLEDKHRDLQGKADRGEALEEARQMLFKDWAEDWLARAKSRVRDYGTLKIHTNKHLIPTFGKKALTTISTADIDKWQSKQLESLEPGTVKRQLSTFKAILNDAIKVGHLGKNPANDAADIKGINNRQRFLDKAEVALLLAEAEIVADWLPDFLMWLIHSGMRKGEALGLTWKDIQVLPNSKTVAHIRKSKDGKGRTVICTKTMDEILERQKTRAKEKESHSVFPIAAMTLRRKWQKARKNAGLDDVVMHDLRRTHATNAVVAGVDLKTLADRLGHADLSMLEKHYAAMVSSAAEEAVDKIEDVFSD